MRHFLFFLLAITSALGCIGDDIIMDETPEAVRILNRLDTIAVGESYQFEAMFTNNIGVEEDRTIVWSSSDPVVLSITDSGLATALEKGMTVVSATVELEGKPAVTDQFTLIIDEETVVSNPTKMGVLKTTSSYNLKGSFTVEEINGKLTISLSDDYEASTALPGLYIYLGNNPSSISNALEIGAVTVFDGAHTYEVPGVGINDYKYLLYWCKPFGVKVGEGEIQ
jgi:hypothetical protein